jgi:simple sugar transport system permease protein
MKADENSNHQHRNLWYFFRQFLYRVLDEDKSAALAVPILSIIGSIIITSVILLSMGANPVAAFGAFLQGSGFLPKRAYAGGQGMITDFVSFLGIMAPMLLAALSVNIAFKADLLNIGITGQMLLSGFIATVFVGYSRFSPWIAKPMVILIGLAVGGGLGLLVGFLKYRYRIHEVISCIMLDYIIKYVTGFFLNTYYTDPVSRISRGVSAASRLTFTNIPLGKLNMSLPLGIVLAFGAVFLLRYFINRTLLGFEIKAVGGNVFCARYAGISVGRGTLSAMTIAGACAGLAGVAYYLGYLDAIAPKMSPSIGFDAIVAALLGNGNPIGAIFASMLITIFQKGSIYMNSSTRIPREIASVIVGILLLFVSCGQFVRSWAHKKRGQLEFSHGRVKKGL